MAEFPALIIAGAISPPSRPITAEEDEAMVAQINASGARTVWVGLKLPKPKKSGCWRNAAGCGSAIWSPIRYSSSARQLLFGPR
jgi:UDP-N-acetyl-D-mannosaminuronic acid transferase (WecB/TagA/CpsF family)